MTPSILCVEKILYPEFHRIDANEISSYSYSLDILRLSTHPTKYMFVTLSE